MDRRDFLQSVGVLSVHAALQSPSNLYAQLPSVNDWRTFEITTQVEVLKPSGATRVWLPTALASDTPFQKTRANVFTASGGTAKLVENKPDALGIVSADFPTGVKPVLTLRSRVSTHNHTVDLSVRSNTTCLDRATRDHFLRPTKLIPTDGIVKATALDITKSASRDVDKARAIYDWIVVNTFRNPKTRGCGLGDIRFMLESGDLGGKCADLNALYVGLARGLQLRDHGQAGRLAALNRA